MCHSERVQEKDYACLAKSETAVETAVEMRNLIREKERIELKDSQKMVENLSEEELREIFEDVITQNEEINMMTVMETCRKKNIDLSKKAIILNQSPIFALTRK